MRTRRTYSFVYVRIRTFDAPFSTRGCSNSGPIDSCSLVENALLVATNHLLFLKQVSVPVLLCGKKWGWLRSRSYYWSVLEPILAHCFCY